MEIDKKEIFPGVWLVNKPRRITSYRVVTIFKKLFPGKKVGHAGTLDPLAEGLLIVLVGKATKRQEEFMGLEKEYLTRIVFGVESNTFDLEGEKNFCPKEKVRKITQEKVMAAIKSFGQGYRQTVPPFSAVKVKGVPLYRLARKGRLVIPPQREVVIKGACLQKFTPFQEGKEYFLSLPRAEILLQVGKGFYVRSFAHDLGKKLKVGALAEKIVRTRIGKFSLKEIN
ncbi:tRNA pseudouridine(55) synthase TruB [bacterium]|nr:tRNA pseudouridine(55) synthase TruB [bacterium]